MATVDLGTWLRALSQRAARRDVPADLCQLATIATRRTMCEMDGRPLTAAEKRRCAAYYEAVVRRRMVRGSQNRRAASRAVLDAVVADLASAGRDGAAIAEELERGWAHALPADLIFEYQARLCG